MKLFIITDTTGKQVAMNIDHIILINETTTGHTEISLTGGNVVTINLQLDYILKIIENVQHV